jgi:hypothetical protein
MVSKTSLGSSGAVIKKLLKQSKADLAHNMFDIPVAEYTTGVAILQEHKNFRARKIRILSDSGSRPEFRFTSRIPHIDHNAHFAVFCLFFM